MALLNQPIVIDGKIWGTLYTLENIGDELPEHVHGEADNHITVLTFGAIECLGHERFRGKIVEAKRGGTILNWIAGEPHGFRAVTPGATFANLLKVRP